MVYFFSKRTLFPFIKLFLKEIKGIENVPKKGPFILTSNYECYMDPSFIFSVIIPFRNQKIHYLVNKARFYKIFGETITKKWGGCVILDEGKEKALQELSSLLKKGGIVGIFIEGSRSMDGKLRKGKTGVVRLALKARVPILPIGLIGTFDIAPGNKLIPKFKRAKMYIGTPIYLDRYYKKKITEKLLRKLTNDIMKIISDLTNKPYNY